MPNVRTLYSNEFLDYCKGLRESDSCSYFINTWGKAGHTKLSVEAKKKLGELSNQVLSSEEIIDSASACELCPYEISIEFAKKAKVIIADYFYIFNPHINEMFLRKVGAELEKSIIIVDEAHNLPDRIRDLATSRLTSIMIERAKKEAKKHKYLETYNNLVLIGNILDHLVESN